MGTHLRTFASIICFMPSFFQLYANAFWYKLVYTIGVQGQDPRILTTHQNRLIANPTSGQVLCRSTSSTWVFYRVLLHEEPY